MSSKKLIVFINSAIFIIAFNLPILMQRYFEYKAVNPEIIYTILIDLFFSLLIVFPILYVCTVSKFLTFFIYIISGFTSYFIYKFNLTLNTQIIGAFFEASLDEVKIFINLEFFFELIYSALLSWICILSINLSKVSKQENQRIFFICLIFVIGAIFGDGEAITVTLPYSALRNSITYFLEKKQLIRKREDISQKFQYKLDDKSKDLNIVLIIGESARADHFGLSGYKRNTTPLIAKEKNLIYYNNVTACYPLTRIAVPCIITRNTRDNLEKFHETSFISIFKSLGLYTSWIGIQGTRTAIDTPFLELANEANKTIFPAIEIDLSAKNDSSLLPFIDEFYKNQTSSNLLVIHTFGSHFHYSDRYPQQFEKYKPTCPVKTLQFTMGNCSQEEMLNSYDNSIIHTDYFITKVIEQLRNKNALLIYTSDHGESLGENGRLLHGTHNADEQVAVQMIFWGSDKYIKNYPENYQRLKKLKRDAASHDNLFHSILGCSGVKSEIIDKKLNLCSD